MQARPAPFYHLAPLYFSLLLLTALVGFYPSFYSRMGEARVVHQFHGAIATLWLLMLISQAWLVRARRLPLHRLMGRLSVVLALLFVVSGLMIVHDMLSNDSGFSKAFGPRLAFIDLSSILYFAFAYGMAIHYRRDMGLHARFMASTALPLLPPALARVLGSHILPDGSSFDMALHLAFACAELVVLALLLDDRRRGKLRAPYLILLAVLLVQHASYNLSLEVKPWRDAVMAVRPA
jgi:hypothetical protein